MNPNEKRKLGRTDVELIQFGFGSASLGKISALVSEEEAQATLQAVRKHGARYIDTAPFYGFGLSEPQGGQFSVSTTTAGVCSLHQGGTHSQSP